MKLRAGDSDDLEIGHRRRNDLEHHVGAGSHHRRHQRAPRTGGGLDPAGNMPRKTGTPHHRNREGAGGRGVGDRAPRERPHESTGENRNFGGATGGFAKQTPGRLDDESGGARGTQIYLRSLQAFLMILQL